MLTVNNLDAQGSYPNYECNLKIYVVEIESRWDDYSHVPYNFGFLDFAYDADVSVAFEETFDKTIIWDGAEEDFADVLAENLMVIAVVFNSESHLAYSNPPSGAPFAAFYTEATAAATIDTGYNNTDTVPGFTHTVFVEVGTRSTCAYCVRTRNAMHQIYTGGAYPFFYTALVNDMNSLTVPRLMTDFNFVDSPTSYFDGGAEVLADAPVELQPYIDEIVDTGDRDIHELDLSVSLSHIADAQYEIQVSLTSNEIVNTPPNAPVTPSGESEGIKDSDVIFSSYTIESNDDRVYFQWDWGNFTYSDWLGPYDSEEVCHAYNTWNDSGLYSIRVRAKDEFDLAGSWSDYHDIHILRFLCGDVNTDGDVNLTDILNTISSVYVEPIGEPLSFPPEAADVNNDGSVNLTDILNLISNVYITPPTSLICPD